MKFIPGGPARMRHQKRGLAKMISTRGVAGLLFEPGTGKGHPLDEPVLTPGGWRAVGDLEVGDEVIGSQGYPVKVTGVFDRGTLPVYRVTFHDGAQVRVDGDHLWRVHYGRGRARTVSTDTLRSLRRVDYYSVPTTAVEHPQRDFPLDPYMLGALLSDGALSGRGIVWTKNDLGVVQEMREACERSGFTLTEKAPSTSARRWSVERSNLSEVLDDLGLRVKSRDKFLPSRYLVGSIAQRWTLVRGLFDGDGSVRRGVPRYTSVSRRLVWDVQQLLWSLGVGAKARRVRHYRGDYWEAVVYGKVNPFTPGTHNYSRVTGTSLPPKRSFASIDPEGMAEVRCIQVDAEDHLYVTRDYVVTHNTATTLDYASLLALKSPTREARVLVVAPLAAVDTWVLQARTFVSPQVNYWSEALGGSLRQRGEALAARGGRPFKSYRPPRGRKHAPRAAHYWRSLGLDARKQGEALGDLSQGPEGLGSALPRLVLVSVNFDTFSSRQRIGSRTMADYMMEAVKRFDPDLVVVDESHKIKGVSSNVSRLLGRIGEHVPRRVILTGTVMPHSPLDVYGQWRFLEPTAFGQRRADGSRKRATFGHFRGQFAVMGGYMGREVKQFVNLDTMQDIMARNAVVATKAEALDLPATTDNVVTVHLSRAEARAYQEMKSALAVSLSADDTAQVTAMNRLAQMMRLRQITSGHLPDDAGAVHTLGHSKVATITSLVTDTLGSENRLVIFVLFTHEVRALHQALAAAEPHSKVEVIAGHTPDRDRISIRARFGDTGTHPERIILIAQISTLSLAVNELVTASHAVFGSLSQKRDDIVQARDRLNRIGQKRPVTYWYALAPRTVDEVIYQTYLDRSDLEANMLRHIRESL